MEKIKFTNLLMLCLMLFGSQAFAQTFPGTTGPVPAVGTSGPATFTATAAGIGTIGAGAATLDNVTLTSLTHTFDGDLEIDLISPAGTNLVLSDNNGGAGDNFINTVFEDGGGDITLGAAPFSGTFQAQGGTFAAAFDGEAADGDWTLDIQDLFGGDSGNMNDWEMNFTAAPAPPGGGGGGGVTCDLQCPESVIVATTDPGSACSAFVTIPQPLTNGGCDLSTLTHDYPDGSTITDASGVYPFGTTLVTYCITDMATGTDVCCTVEVIVQDNTAPELTCPGDMTINLDAGECEAFLDFDISAFDECNTQDFSFHQNGGLAPDGFLAGALGVAGGGVVCGFANEAVGYARLFDLTALGVPASQEFVVTAVDYVLNTNSPANPVTVNVYSYPAGTTVPTMAGGTLLATASTTQPVSFGNTLHTQLIDAVIPAGEMVLVTTEAVSNVFGGTIFAMEGGPFGGAPELAPSYVFGCPSLGIFPDFTDLDGFFAGGSHMVQLNGSTLDPSVPVTADPGNPFANGDALPIGGPHCFIYTAEDLAGNVATCEFCVTIQEYPNPSGSLTCNAQSGQVSLDDNCEAIIGADDVLEGGNYGCYDDYIVDLFYDENLTQPITSSPLVTSQQIGQIIWVRVTDPETGNNCWSSLLVEDKIIPALECEDFTIACTDSGIPGSEFGLTESLDIPGVASADNATVSSAADYDNPGSTITDINVAISSDHTWVGDLTIEIVSPSGTTVQLLDNWNNAGICGGCAGNGLEVTFDDAATLTPADLGNTCNNAPAAEGTYQPVDALSAFNGEDPNGTWTINIADACLGDNGTTSATVMISTSGNVVELPLPAGATVTPQDLANGQPYTVIGFDPCSAVILTYVDTEAEGDCVADPFIKQITRTWTAVDASGNEATCSEIITVIRSTVADVVFPLNRDDLELPSFSCTGGYATDANGHPAPSASGYPTINGQPIISGDACEFGVTYEDLVIPICEGTYKILRTWTVLAWCPTTDVATDLQIIKVVDDQGPNLVCSPDQTISTSQQDCTASAIIAYPTVTDACGTPSFVSVTVSNGTLNAQNTAVFGLPLGITTVTFIYVDACGNESTCSYDINVVDQVPPVAICESFHVVGLTIDEPTLVPALIFDDGSYDNCNLVEYLVRRMDNPNCPGFDGTPFGPFAPFYCCDVGGPNVMVELRVRDEAGNTNSCMIEVEVQDKLNPAIQCPPNLILDCYEDPFDLNITGYATASDNCSAEVTFFDNGDLDNCGEGTIFRIWTATDPGGRTASCVQRIDVINSDPFEICDTEGWCNPTAPSCTHPLFNVFQHTLADDVEWPCDVELSTCGPGLLPEDLEANPAVNNNDARPRIFEDGCDLVGVTYEDVYLPITPPACVKVLRTWKVYDWCTFDAENFDPNNPTASAGYWEYTQIIKVLESAAPVILSDCENISFCSYDPNCQIGPATLLLNAEDDCTLASDLNYYYWIDIDNDGVGPVIHSTGADASGNYPIGTHSIRWDVEDGCGNVATCTYLFVIADCKNPTPNLLNGIATEMMEDCMIEIWATDFDNPSSPSFDNCGIQEWRIYSPSQGPGQTAPPAGATANWTFSGVDDLGTNTVDVWILDVNGNWSYVSTYILVQDNLAPFCEGIQASISGEVETEEAAMVSSAMVMLEGGAPGLPEYDEMMTDVDGLYGFPQLANGGNYIVTPEKDINPLNGVSTFDLVKISQHILEVDLLPSPYKIISADINHDGNVTTVDLVQLRRLILFIDTEFQNNTSWRFVEANFVFPDPTDPFETSFPEVFTVNGLDDAEVADFIAMKIGDVNCSASPNGLVGGADDRSVGDLTFGIQDEQMKAGETYTVDFTAKDFASVYGYQFTLGFDNSAVEFEGIEAGALTNLTDANFGMAMINEGVITTSWNNSTAVSMDDKAVLFSVTFTANANAKLSEVLSVNSRYTKAEAYDNSGVLDINVEFNTEDGVVVAGKAFELYQNQPNPFKDETNIGFNLPEAGFATLTVYDVSGRVLRVVEADFAKGYNEVTLDRSEIAGTGVLYYQLDTENDSATKKMIIIK